MSQFAAGLYSLADRLDEIEEINQERAEYTLTGEEEYRDFTTLLDQSDLVTGDGTDTDLVYADFIDGQTAHGLMDETDDTITSRIVSNEGDEEHYFDNTDNASVFFDWVRHRAGYSQDDSHIDHPAREDDSRREYVLHDRPFLTLAETGGDLEYGLFLIGREKGESPCVYIRERFPGDIVHMSGTVQPDTAALDDYLEEIAQETSTDRQDTTPLPDGDGEQTALEELYTERFGKPESFGFDEYHELTEEVRDNIRQLDGILTSMRQYVQARAVELGELEVDDDLDQQPPGLYQDALETKIREFGNGYNGINRALRFTDLGVHLSIPLGDDEQIIDEWSSRLKDEDPLTYETLHDNHQRASVATTKTVDTFRPKMRGQAQQEGAQVVDPAFLMAQIDMQGFGSVDEYLEELFDSDVWDGNETTDMMFQ